MTFSLVRCGAIGLVGACAAGSLVAGAGVLPVADAAPCKASGFAATASGVLSSAGAYLDAHPAADDVLTAAASQPPEVARTSVRGYFIAHPGEFLDLQRIVQPLKDVKAQCGVDLSPSQLASLFEALAE
ncbi:heme-binding protein [Mycobacterium sp. NPDC006124]|uniref:heme-binding protein n=1 Tax=Mycobacterium sp. NPDC006124 TaxID=3156729 RepID=UPI0033BAAADC